MRPRSLEAAARTATGRARNERFYHAPRAGVKRAGGRPGLPPGTFGRRPPAKAAGRRARQGPVQGSGGHGMKTIGVIGGLGPQATMDFEQRIHRVAQGRIPPHGNQGYPPMVVLYHRRPPVVVNDDSTPRLPLTLDPGLLDAARTIGASADFLVILANLPHLFQPEIERASGREVLSMIDVTLEAVRARGWRRIGAVGLGLPTIYTDRFAALGLTAETLTAEQRVPLDRAIIGLIEGRDTDASRQHAHDAVATLRDRGVDGIILGCTEIPLLLGPAADAPDLVSPAQLLAEAAVARAIA